MCSTTDFADAEVVDTDVIRELFEITKFFVANTAVECHEGFKVLEYCRVFVENIEFCVVLVVLEKFNVVIGWM